MITTAYLYPRTVSERAETTEQQKVKTIFTKAIRIDNIIKITPPINKFSI